MLLWLLAGLLLVLRSLGARWGRVGTKFFCCGETCLSRVLCFSIRRKQLLVRCCRAGLRPSRDTAFLPFMWFAASGSSEQRTTTMCDCYCFQFATPSFLLLARPSGNFMLRMVFCQTLVDVPASAATFLPSCCDEAWTRPSHILVCRIPARSEARSQ